jgi:hypothetical protein
MWYEDLSQALTKYLLSAVNSQRVEHSLQAITEVMYALVRPLDGPQIDTDRLIKTAALWVYTTHRPDQFSIKQAARRSKITPFDLERQDVVGKPAWQQAEVLDVSRATITNHRRWLAQAKTDYVKARYWRAVVEMKKWLAGQKVIRARFVAAQARRAAARKVEEARITALVTERFKNLLVIRVYDEVRVLLLPVGNLMDLAPPPRDTSFDDLLAF